MFVTSERNLFSSTTLWVKIVIKNRFSVSHFIQIMSVILACNLPSCVCEFISVSDGACCARQPGSSGATLCGQGTVCPLSCCFEFTTNLTAASSLIHCSRWRRACCSRVRVFAHFFWRGSCGKHSFAHCCVQLHVQATKRRTIEIKLWSLKDQRISKKGRSQTKLG